MHSDVLTLEYKKQKRLVQIGDAEGAYNMKFIDRLTGITIFREFLPPFSRV